MDLSLPWCSIAWGLCAWFLSYVSNLCLQASLSWSSLPWSSLGNRISVNNRIMIKAVITVSHKLSSMSQIPLEICRCSCETVLSGIWTIF